LRNETQPTNQGIFGFGEGIVFRGSIASDRKMVDSQAFSYKIIDRNLGIVDPVPYWPLTLTALRAVMRYSNNNEQTNFSNVPD